MSCSLPVCTARAVKPAAALGFLFIAAFADLLVAAWLLTLAGPAVTLLDLYVLFGLSDLTGFVASGEGSGVVEAFGSDGVSPVFFLNFPLAMSCQIVPAVPPRLTPFPRKSLYLAPIESNLSSFVFPFSFACLNALLVLGFNLNFGLFLSSLSLSV